jgi:membrane protease YdiL (CAAX protease family)
MVSIDQFFLWPFLIPIFGLLMYSIIYEHKNSRIVGSVLLSGIIVVLTYLYLLESNIFGQYTYIFVKYLLFILIPCLLILFGGKFVINDFIKMVGISRTGFFSSLKWGLLLLPIMLGVTIIVYFYQGFSSGIDVFFGVVSFFESFSEEFFFRGILFLLLIHFFRFEIVFIVSLFSFILVHPHHLSNVFIFVTIIQGLLTLEIVRRSKNLTGAWLLHGMNRLFSLLVIPFLMG